MLGFRAGRPDRLRPADRRGRRARCDPGGKDASAAEREIDFCNGGVMALAGKTALAILDQIDDTIAKKEFYLTDAVAIARAKELKAVAIETTEDEVRGVNTQAQLAEAEAILQDRLRKAALEAGVNMVAPQTVYLAADTKFGRDVVVEPYVVFGPGVHGRGRRADPLVLASRAARMSAAARRSVRMRGCGPARSSARKCASAISSK